MSNLTSIFNYFIFCYYFYRSFAFAASRQATQQLRHNKINISGGIARHVEAKEDREWFKMIATCHLQNFLSRSVLVWL
jgi:hypothetical protein